MTFVFCQNLLMEIIAFLIDFIVNIDEHLETFVAAYGAWIYVLLFLIIFVEIGRAHV